MTAKSNILNKIVSLLLFVLALGLQQSRAGYVESADSAYNKKQFSEALTLYRTALEKDGSSSDLYYNIGNTYYRLNDLGHAVINYKRALMLDPSNADARTNLEYVKTKITDKP